MLQAGYSFVPFLGGMLQTVELAAPYSRPTGCLAVLPHLREAAVAGVLPAGSHRLGFLDTGGKANSGWRSSTPAMTSPVSSAGFMAPRHSTPASPTSPAFRLPIYRPDHQRPHLWGLAGLHGGRATGGRTLSPAGHHSPATLSRLFRTLPPPITEDIDLMAAKKTWSSRKLCPFDIRRQTAVKIKESLKLDMEAFAQYRNKAVRVEEFKTSVKHALLSRCLLSQYSLSHPNVLQLHHEYKEIIGHHPRYMTSLELMENLESMTPSYRNPFLDYLSEDRAIVVEDWDNRLDASAGATIYDHSMMAMSGSMSSDEDSIIYKGECDASFEKGSEKTESGIAKLCIVIWCRDQVLSCIIVEDFECANSVEAEATAMYILLKEGISLGLNVKLFKASTDNDLVYQILWGAHRIKHGGPSANLYRLLKFMRCYYNKLIPQHEPREKMAFVDGLMRMSKGDEANQILAILRKRELDLSGHPIFKFTQKCGITTNLGMI